MKDLIYETDISAKQFEEIPRARFSGQNEYQGRQERTETEEGKRSKTIVRTTCLGVSM